MSYYIYFVHDDGEMMLLADDDEDEGTTRWTPYHRVSDSNMPPLFKTDAKAQKWINEMRKLPNDIPSKQFTAKWEGVERVHANPYGTEEATLRRLERGILK